MLGKGTARLETERLILRQFTYNDIEPMFRNWASNPEVTKYLSWFAHKTPDETGVYVNKWIERYEEDDRYHWAIVLKDINEPIGSIGVVRMNEENKLAEMGYCIGQEYWNKGYTSEALNRVIDYLFSETDFKVIQAGHDIRNPNSGKVMKHCGLKYKGTYTGVRLTKEGDPLTFVVYELKRSNK